MSGLVYYKYVFETFLKVLYTRYMAFSVNKANSRSEQHTLTSLKSVLT